MTNYESYKRRKKKPERRILYPLFISRITESADGKFNAFDSGNRYIGSFDTWEEASKAYPRIDDETPLGGAHHVHRKEGSERWRRSDPEAS